MGRMTFVFRRLLLLIPTVLGVTIITFFMIHLIPGDPARTILGIHATPRGIAILHREWGLNRPLASQYWLFMDRLVHGNLGISLFYNVPVVGLITSHLPPTLWLICYAAVLAIIISVPLAMIAASRKDGVRDHIVRAVPLLGLGMPAFWLALILQTTLAVKFQLFPVSGYGTGIGGHLHSMFLPALVVAIALCPVVIRSLRASMLNVLGADFVTTARAKGVPGRRLFVRHVLRNAVIPAVTVLGINIGFLIGGTLIVEQVFQIPGIGSLMINSIFSRDFPVVQAVALVFGIMVVLVNLLTDVVYASLDPRVRFEPVSAISITPAAGAPQAGDRRAGPAAAGDWYRQPALMTGLVLLAIILFMVIAAPLLTSYNPDTQNLNETLQGSALSTGSAPTRKAGTFSPGCCTAAGSTCRSPFSRCCSRSRSARSSAAWPATSAAGSTSSSCGWSTSSSRSRSSC